MLLMGLILAPGRRTGGSALRAVGLDKEQRFSSLPSVLNRAVWSGREAGHVLLSALAETFVPDGPLVIVVDETLQ